MRYDEDGGIKTVTLSRRNLLSLLTKLDDPCSHRTLFQHISHGIVVVTAEEDADHYVGREPGPMSPKTEKEIAEWKPSTSR